MSKPADKLFISRFIKKHGKLEFKNKQDLALFNHLTQGLREGAVVTFMVDFADDNGSLMQIAKLKSGTREIARESGHSFIEVEQEIKKNAGLYDELEKLYKSFANCSREELSNAIQVMINLGDNMNLNLR